MVLDSGLHIIVLTSLMMLISFIFSRFVVAMRHGEDEHGTAS
jgi:hypothetical protein